MRSKHTITSFALLASLGISAILGEGLHLLSGLGHDASNSQRVSRCEAGRCLFHQHEFAPSATDDGTNAVADPHHDCAVCRFLAMTQEITETAEYLPFLHTATYPMAAKPIAVHGPIVRAYRTRAPPALKIS